MSLLFLWTTLKLFRSFPFWSATLFTLLIAICHVHPVFRFPPLKSRGTWFVYLRVFPAPSASLSPLPHRTFYQKDHNQLMCNLWKISMSQVYAISSAVRPSHPTLLHWLASPSPSNPPPYMTWPWGRTERTVQMVWWWCDDGVMMNQPSRIMQSKCINDTRWCVSNVYCVMWTHMMIMQPIYLPSCIGK